MIKKFVEKIKKYNLKEVNKILNRVKNNKDNHPQHDINSKYNSWDW